MIACRLPSRTSGWAGSRNGGSNVFRASQPLIIDSQRVRRSLSTPWAITAIAARTGVPRLNSLLPLRLIPRPETLSIIRPLTMNGAVDASIVARNSSRPGSVTAQSVAASRAKAQPSPSIRTAP